MRIAAAGLLVAAAVSARPAFGRLPDEPCCESPRPVNPWRVAKVNPWRGEVPAPEAANDQKQLFQFYIGLFGPDASGVVSQPACQGASACDHNRPAGWFIYNNAVRDCPPPVIVSGYSDRPHPVPSGVRVRVVESRTGQFMISGAINSSCTQAVAAEPPTPLTIEDVVRISGRDPVTLAPVPRCCQQPASVVRVAAVEPLAVSRAAGNKLHGTWYRELPGAVVAFTFAGDELKAVASVNIDGVSGCVTLTADYAMSKDGTIHGVITGADATGSGGELGGLEMVSIAVVAQMFVDQPFALRVKPTGDGLMLSSVRFPAAEPLMEQGPAPKVSSVLCGLYRPAKGGTIPTAKALKMSGDAPAGEPCCDGLLDVLGGLFGRQTPCGGMTLPSPKYLEHYPQYFPPTEVYVPPAQPAGQPVCLPQPYVMPLPGSPCPVPPQACPLPAPPMPVGAVVPYLPPGCVPPPMVAFPPPPPQVFRAEMVPPRTGYGGEWNRTVGPCTIGLSVTAIQLTAKGMMPVNGELMRVVVTADCREIREGLVAGVITCAEVEPVGTTANWDTDPGRLRGLVDQPFSCRFQVRGDELIVIDLKVGGEHQIDADDLGIIGGRYAKGEPKWPADGKSKKGTATTGSGAVMGGALGSGVGSVVGSATDYPKIGALGGGLAGAATGTANTGDVIRIGIDFNAPPPYRMAFPAGQPAPGTVLPMPAPEPLPEPPVPDRPKGKGKKKGMVNTYSADPNARMMQLLHDSEDLRKLGEQWRRAWFNDQPQHLTPERVHGGIN
jgi:hypothetical protein